MSEHVSIERMHDLLDGLLPADEAGRVRTHVNRCAACAAERAALAGTLEGLRSLPRDAAAPEGAWADIERRIAGGTPPAGARVGEVLEFPTARAAARRLSLTVPQAVAAALTISLVSAGTAWTLRSGPPGDGPPPAAAALEAPTGATEGTRLAAMGAAGYEAAVQELEGVVSRGRGVLAPETLETLDRSLDTIDDALRDVRRALDADPSSEILARMLVSHQRSRLRLLRQAAISVQAAS